MQGGSDFSVNGNPSTNNLFLIDGVNNNDVGSNRTILIYPSVDAIAEFKMLTNSYGPEYGQASGAIISITTRSGGNQFHGGVFYEGRNDALDAAGYIADLDKLPKPSLRRNDWGYFVGGPVVKDKLFFWWNQEWNRDLRGQIVTQCVPTAAERGGDFSADVTAELASINSGAATVGTNGVRSAFPNTTCNAPTPATLQHHCTGTLRRRLFPLSSRAPATHSRLRLPTLRDSCSRLTIRFPIYATNIPGSNFNYASGAAGKVPWREENARIDFNLTKRNQIAFRYTQDSWKFPAPNNAFGWGDDNFATYQGIGNNPPRASWGS